MSTAIETVESPVQTEYKHGFSLPPTPAFGVKLMNLAMALSTEAALVRRHLFEHADAGKNAFAAHGELSEL